MRSDSAPIPQEWPDFLDALVAAPGHHQLLIENDRVGVLDTRIAAGDRTPVHTHRWPSVLAIIFAIVAVALVVLSGCSAMPTASTQPTPLDLGGPPQPLEPDAVMTDAALVTPIADIFPVSTTTTPITPSPTVTPFPTATKTSTATPALAAPSPTVPTVDIPNGRTLQELVAAATAEAKSQPFTIEDVETQLGLPADSSMLSLGCNSVVKPLGKPCGVLSTVQLPSSRDQDSPSLYLFLADGMRYQTLFRLEPNMINDDGDWVFNPRFLKKATIRLGEASQAVLHMGKDNIDLTITTISVINSPQNKTEDGVVVAQLQASLVFSRSGKPSRGLGNLERLIAKALYNGSRTGNPTDVDKLPPSLLSLLRR